MRMCLIFERLVWSRAVKSNISTIAFFFFIHIVCSFHTKFTVTFASTVVTICALLAALSTWSEHQSLSNTCSLGRVRCLCSARRVSPFADVFSFTGRALSPFPLILVCMWQSNCIKEKIDINTTETMTQRERERKKRVQSLAYESLYYYPCHHAHDSSTHRLSLCDLWYVCNLASPLSSSPYRGTLDYQWSSEWMKKSYLRNNFSSLSALTRLMTMDERVKKRRDLQNNWYMWHMNEDQLYVKASSDTRAHQKTTVRIHCPLLSSLALVHSRCTPTDGWTFHYTMSLSHFLLYRFTTVPFNVHCAICNVEWRHLSRTQAPEREMTTCTVREATVCYHLTHCLLHRSFVTLCAFALSKWMVSFSNDHLERQRQRRETNTLGQCVEASQCLHDTQSNRCSCETMWQAIKYHLFTLV